MEVMGKIFIQKSRFYTSFSYFGNKNIVSTSSTKKTSVTQIGSVSHGDIYFRDSASAHKQSEFYHHFRRKKIPNGPDVVTMQDVKNVWNDLMDRRQYKDSKLKHYTAQYRENNCKLILCELRCKMGQCYAEIILGEGRFHKYHHSKRSIHSDKSFFDTFTRYCARFVWIALLRNQFSQIQTEMQRLFQSEDFYTMNLAMISKKGLRLDLDEIHVIYGKDSSFIRSKYEKSHMYQTSPSIFDVIHRAKEFKDDSFQLLNNDQLFSMKSIHFINGAIIIPEELLQTVDINLGLIGKPRKNFEPLLQAKEIEAPDELDFVKLKSKKSQVLSSNVTHSAKELFNMLNEFRSFKMFPERVRVLGKYYSFVDAVTVLTYEHKKESKNAQMQWIKEYCSSLKL